MNILLFFAALIVSFIVVRIGAIAFQLTGLEWSLAKFQSLSCFTGTGFTTKEAELITGNPQRRRIASVLIVFGHAGLVTLIATFANSLRPNIMVPKFTIPFVHLVLPSQILPWANLLIISITIYLIYRIFTRTKIAKVFTDKMRSHIIKKEIMKPVTFEELIVATGGYGVSGVEIEEKSSIVGKTLREIELRKQGVSVLAIERRGETAPNPSADMKILEGDRLICFGKLEDIRKALWLTQ